MSQVSNLMLECWNVGMWHVECGTVPRHVECGMLECGLLNMFNKHMCFCAVPIPKTCFPHQHVLETYCVVRTMLYFHGVLRLPSEHNAWLGRCRLFIVALRLPCHALVVQQNYTFLIKQLSKSHLAHDCLHFCILQFSCFPNL